MGQEVKKRILKLFFEQPNKEYHIREIAKITKIPKTTVARYVKLLLKEGLVKKEKRVFYSYMANETSFFYKFYKKIYLLEEIYKSGLVDYLEKRLYPKSIILFGSGAKGEYVKDSDLDIFVQSKEQELDLTEFERKLGHKINLFFEEKFEKLSSELFNNIINGIKLSGYIKLR